MTVAISVVSPRSPRYAKRLLHCFGTSERFWLNLQTRYDLEVAKNRLQGQIEKEVAVQK